MSSSGLSGESPMASVNTARNGGAMHDPIPGDMLRTAHSKPQVNHYGLLSVNCPKPGYVV